jgi:hypothetical protein
MLLNLLEELNIKGHLTISKLFPTGSEEIVFDDHNIIVSGMGVALAHMFSLSGSNSILDYQIDRFQIGVSGKLDYLIPATNKVLGSLSSQNEYLGTGGDVLTTSAYQIINNNITQNPPAWYVKIPEYDISRIGNSIVRYTLFIDIDSCNNIRRGGLLVPLNEIGLFIKNIKNNPSIDAPILVAYKNFSGILKTSEFSLVFRWSINF